MNLINYFNLINIFTPCFFASMLLIVTYIVLSMIYNQSFLVKNDLKTILKKLKITNFYYSFFLVIIYFLLNFLFLFIMRIIYINTVLGTPYIFNFSVNFLYLLVGILFYYKIINLLFYESLIKIHIYFYQIEKYRKFSEFVAESSYTTSKNFSNFCYKFSRYTLDKLDFIDSLKVRYYLDNLEKYENLNELQNLDISYYYELPAYKKYKIVNKYKALRFFCITISFINKKINQTTNLSNIIYYLPHLLLFVSFIYDLRLGSIYYFYIFLLVFIFFNFVKKLRNFYERKFTGYDYRISQCIYMNKNLVFDKKEKELNEALEIYIGNNETELIEYIKNDFTRDIFLKLKKDIYFSNIRTQRLLIIFLFLLASYFSFYYNKFIFIIYNYNINISIFFLCLSLILYLIHRKISFYNFESDSADEKFLPKWFFRIFVLFFGFISLYVLLINKIVLCPTEIIFYIKDIVTIQEIFN